jgi:hypothetical protein
MKDKAYEVTMLFVCSSVFTTACHLSLPESDKSYFLNIHFDSILSYRTRLSEQSLSSGFSLKILYAFLFSYMHATFPGHLILLDFMMEVIFRKDHKS